MMTYMRSLYPLDWQNFLVRLCVHTSWMSDACLRGGNN